jgi:hypothetical protein
MASEEEEIQVTCRIPRSVARRIDGEIRRLEKERPESRVTRASVLRALACKFVDEMDSDVNRKRKAG